MYPNPEHPEHARLPCRVATRGFGLPNGRVATSEARLCMYMAASLLQKRRKTKRAENRIGDASERIWA